MDHGLSDAWKQLVHEPLSSILLGVLTVLVLRKGLGLGHVRAISSSMRPTLIPGDRALIIRMFRPPRHGEVWLHIPPASAVSRPGRRLPFIRRIIGLPGDTIEVGVGSVTRNGEILAEPYVHTPPHEMSLQYSVEPTTLGPDEYYMLGDYRTNSNDSHLHGPLSLKSFRSRVLWRVWPPIRWGPL